MDDQFFCGIPDEHYKLVRNLFKKYLQVSKLRILSNSLHFRKKGKSQTVEIRYSICTPVHRYIHIYEF